MGKNMRAKINNMTTQNPWVVLTTTVTKPKPAPKPKGKGKKK